VPTDATAGGKQPGDEEDPERSARTHEVVTP
jgi:hypothetical protein